MALQGEHIHAIGAELRGMTSHFECVIGYALQAFACCTQAPFCTYHAYLSCLGEFDVYITINTFGVAGEELAGGGACQGRGWGAHTQCSLW